MDQDELVEIMAKARDAGSTRLDLSGKGLTELPAEIGNLTCLTELNLRNNQLKGVLPPELGNLTSLTMLDLSINLQASLPPEMLELRN